MRKAYPQMILDGDRNIGTVHSPNTASTQYQQYLEALSMGHWLSAQLRYGHGSAGDLHLKSGNLGMADGHAAAADHFRVADGLGHRHQRRANPSPGIISRIIY